MIQILPVTPENRADVLALRVKPDQQGYIETTGQCLEEAAALPLWRPVGLYANRCLVGFAMYGCWKEEGASGRVWLDRFLIDGRYQGRGYGGQALRALLDRIAGEYACDEVYLSLYADNRAAEQLYRKFGFVYNGEQDIHGEQVMVLRLNERNNG